MLQEQPERDTRMLTRKDGEGYMEEVRELQEAGESRQATKCMYGIYHPDELEQRRARYGPTGKCHSSAGSGGYVDGAALTAHSLPPQPTGPGAESRRHRREPRARSVCGAAIDS